MIAVLIAVAVAGACVWVGWYVDQRLLKCQTLFRLFLAFTLLSIGTWLISIIPLALWFRVPAAYGPVQYWHDVPGGGLDFMAVRALALFLATGGFLIGVAMVFATVVALFAESPVSRWRRCILPAVALTVYVVAYRMFVVYEFFPSA